MIGLWIVGLLGGVILAFAFLELAYPGSGSADDGRVDQSYAVEISTVRAGLEERAATAATEASQSQSGTDVAAQSSPVAGSGTQPTPTTTPMPFPERQLSGSGTMLSEPVELVQGLVIVTSEHFGTGRFQVTAFDSAGNQLSRTAAGSGAWRGSSSLIVPTDGSYIFEVVADGDWLLDIMYPVADASTISELPFNRRGSGFEVLHFLQAETGTHRLTAHCGAEGSLRIIAVSVDASYQRVLLDTACPFEGTVAFPVPDRPLDVFLLNVSGQGDWAIHIQ